MIRDIPFKKVEDIAIAVAPSIEQDEEIWRVYLVNMKDEPIEKVLVNSRGYGTIEGKQVQTSSLRQFFEQVDAKTYVVLEVLPDELKGISNQFWVSFWHEGFLYDKKYVFVTESLKENYFTKVPILNRNGVMIK